MAHKWEFICTFVVSWFVVIRLTHLLSRESPFTDYHRKYHFSKWQKNEMAQKSAFWERRFTQNTLEFNVLSDFLSLQTMHNARIIEWHKRASIFSLHFNEMKQTKQPIQNNNKRQDQADHFDLLFDRCRYRHSYIESHN